MYLRRLTALLVLAATTASTAEAVVGVLRDGAVHHESPVTAASHATSAAGDHGHEDATPPGTHRHGQGHDHGTSGDHCTHAHGAALVPVFAFTLPAHESVLGFNELAVHLARTSYPRFHPPKA